MSNVSSESAVSTISIAFSKLVVSAVSSVSLQHLIHFPVNKLHKPTYNNLHIVPTQHH